MLYHGFCQVTFFRLTVPVSSISPSKIIFICGYYNVSSVVRNISIPRFDNFGVFTCTVHAAARYQKSRDGSYTFHRFSVHTPFLFLNSSFSKIYAFSLSSFELQIFDVPSLRTWPKSNFVFRIITLIISLPPKSWFLFFIPCNHLRAITVCRGSDMIPNWQGGAHAHSAINIFIPFVSNLSFKLIPAETSVTCYRFI